MASPQTRETPLAGGVFAELTKANSSDSPLSGLSDQALSIIEGEEYGAAFLQRLRGGQGTAGELATLLGFLDGDMLVGACGVICKALQEVRHA